MDIKFCFWIGIENNMLKMLFLHKHIFIKKKKKNVILNN